MREERRERKEEVVLRYRESRILVSSHYRKKAE